MICAPISSTLPPENADCPVRHSVTALPPRKGHCARRSLFQSLARARDRAGADDDVAARLRGVDRLRVEIHAAGRRFEKMFYEAEIEHFHVAALLISTFEGLMSRWTIPVRALAKCFGD